MESSVFDRETLLDLSVNVIPLFIIVFFVGLFAFINPFGFNPVDTAIQMALLIIPFVGLAVLTYYSGLAIARDEEKLETEAAGQIEAGEPPESDAGQSSEENDAEH